MNTTLKLLSELANLKDQTAGGHFAIVHLKRRGLWQVRILNTLKHQTSIRP